ncbi:MAG: SRPBCC domain-containing protein [Bacteroidota bacterium]
MKTLKKKYLIQASFDCVFDALTNEQVIERWSGSKASMDITDGGAFSLWEGAIVGFNKAVSRDRVIQAWKQSQWQDYSTVTISLQDFGQLTQVNLEQHGIPGEFYQAINIGWDDYYFKPLIELVENYPDECPF